jgi:hypothetical protein
MSAADHTVRESIRHLQPLRSIPVERQCGASREFSSGAG